MKVAVIGDSTFIKGFELVGAEGYKATNIREVRTVLRTVINSRRYAVVIIPERYVEETRDIRQRIIKSQNPLPLFAFLPDYTGIKGARIEELRRIISLAVGIELKI